MNLKVGAAVGGAVVVLAAVSTLGLGAAMGAFQPAVTAPRVGPQGPRHGSAACVGTNLPGTVVTATLTDRAAMMGSGITTGPGGMMRGRSGRSIGSSGWSFPQGMMAVTLNPTWVTTGTISLQVLNAGSLPHELLVLPLTDGAQPGQRPVGSDGRVNEEASLGEASRTCGAGSGEGIAARSAGWVTLDLAPGRYELICNLPGHYAAGMRAELDVRG